MAPSILRRIAIASAHAFTLWQVCAATAALAAVERCGEPVPVTAALVGSIEKHLSIPLGRSDAVLAAQLADGEGAVLFIRRNGRWRGYGIAGAAGIERIYRSPAGDVFVWAFEGLGSPPVGFAGFRVGSTPGSHFCTSISNPPSINSPDYRGEVFQFDHFNVDDAGRGTILGSARVERGGREQNWRFRYRSTNGGRTWSAPERVGATRPPAGLFAPAGREDAALLARLRRAAR